MTTETILGPALDDPVLERLEAEFLHNPSGSWWPAESRPVDRGAAASGRRLAAGR